MQKIEYFQTSYETKLNLADAFISELAVKYCENQMKLNQPKKAVEFSKRIYRVQEVFGMVRTVVGYATRDNQELLNKLKQAEAKLYEYERTDKALNELQPNKQMEDEILAIKDKYQIRIQELEIENDQLLKKLIRQNSES